jgi:hypothetical protein
MLQFVLGEQFRIVLDGGQGGGEQVDDQGIPAGGLEVEFFEAREERLDGLAGLAVFVEGLGNIGKILDTDFD